MSTVTFNQKVTRLELILLGVVTLVTMTIGISLTYGFPAAVMSLIASFGVLVTCIGMEA
jgi:hypothetical protein